MSKLKTQFGASATADFEEKTWTFEMNEETFRVTAGAFAIIPEPLYQKILSAIKGIGNSMAAHPDCSTNSEFEGMVSRCKEVLEELI